MEKYKESPDIVSFIDSEHSKLTIEFAFVRIEKENINLTIYENGCSLFAPGEDSDYTAVLSFCCPVKPSEAKARYKDGYLTVEVPFRDPIKGAVKVPIEED